MTWQAGAFTILALALAAGEIAWVALLEAREADELSRLCRGLAADSLVHQVVAGVLEQQRHLTRALDASPGRLHQAGGVAKEHRFAGAVPAHHSDPLAR